MRLRHVRRSGLLDETDDRWICTQDVLRRSFAILRRWVGTLVAASLEAWFH
jgi:hypothetical protein